MLFRSERAILYGNLILGNSSLNENWISPNVDIDANYNLITIIDTINYHSSNIIIQSNDETELLSSILDGTYDTATDIFTPNLAYHGGFTPTVALKSDRLPDGTSIRFPLTETTVTEDQRGVERSALTCMVAV